LSLSVSICCCYTANDDDDDDDKVANDAVTVWLILDISRMLVLAVTNAQV